MKLLFKQRLLSWLDSYDIYDEFENPIFKVKGKLSFGHLLCIYDNNGNELGRIKQRIFSFWPKFSIFIGDNYVGCIKKEFTFLKPTFTVDYNGWRADGDFFEFNYTILDGFGNFIANVSKQFWNWTDTYAIDVADPSDALCALMLVLAIDAEKCSRHDSH